MKAHASLIYSAAASFPFPLLNFFFSSASDFGGRWSDFGALPLSLSLPSLFSRLLQVIFLDFSFDGNICSCMLKFLITRDFKSFVDFIGFKKKKKMLLAYSLEI